MTPNRRFGRVVVAVLVALALVAVAGCSDAPTEAEIKMADDGVDPSIVSIFVTQPLLEVTQELGSVFVTSHPGTTFQYTAQDSATLQQRIDDGFKPAMWIDLQQQLAGMDGKPGVVGPPHPFGDDQMQFVAAKSYRGPKPTLQDFGSAGDSPARTGLCDPTEPCGAAAEQILDQQGIVPAPDSRLPTGHDLIVAMKDGQVDVGLLYRTDTTTLYTFFTYYQLPDPEVGRVVYQTLLMRDTPIIQDFQTWIETSPEAQAILEKRGYRNREGIKYL